MSPELLKKILDAIASGDEKAQAALLPEIVAAMAGAEGAPDTSAPADPLAAAADPAAPKPEEAAAMSALMKLTGKASLGEAIAHYTSLATRVTKLDADSAVLELSSRRELVGDLVKLGAELPATAWEPLADNAAADAPRTPVKRLMSEPVADLRARVALLGKSKPAAAKIEPPEAGGTDTLIALSKDEVAFCAKHGLTPEQYAAKKAGSVKVHNLKASK